MKQVIVTKLLAFAPGAKRINWYWNRLSLMSPGEIAHRLYNSYYKMAQRAGLFRANELPKRITTTPVHFLILPIKPRDETAYQTAARRLLQGKLQIFGREVNDMGPQYLWNRDPKSNVVAPLQFGKDLNYRDESIVGDIKYLWEPNRHLHLVTLAQAYCLDHDRRWLDSITANLQSWLDQCPYLKGPNWISSLELAIRLINWGIVWDLTGGLDGDLFHGEKGKRFREHWLASIYQHSHFIQKNLSRYSSANNHLIGELSGLVCAAATWPYWESLNRWGERARVELVRQADIQNTPDGVNREQATSYQQFVLDFLIIAGLRSRVSGVEFPRSYWNKVEVMLDYIASIMDAGTNVPMIGDADDGYVVRLSQEPEFCPYRSLLATGAILFERGDFKYKAASLDDKTSWLIGPDVDERFDALEAERSSLPTRRAFDEGGYHILGTGFESDHEIRLVVDSGPLGYLSLAAHGHADALAFTLSICGQEFLIDPGTFAYHTNGVWRDYFRGTSAHNTVRVDGENQSINGGNFMWIRKARAWCEHWEPGEDTDQWAGAHDGYRKMSDPVVHRREIWLRKRDRRIKVTDTIECQETHMVERFWHFNEKCEVIVDGKEISARIDDVLLRLKAVQGDEPKIELLRAQESPPAGWVSRSFDVKVPTSTICMREEIKGTTKLVTEMYCERT